jgi:hypothetical protein
MCIPLGTKEETFIVIPKDDYERALSMIAQWTSQQEFNFIADELEGSTYNGYELYST